MRINEDMYAQEKGINSKLVKTVVVNARYKYKVPSKKEYILIEETY